MKCLHLHSPFLPFLSQLKHNQQPSTGKLVWLSSNIEPARPLHSQNIPSKKVHLGTKALNNSLVLGLTSSAKTPDISVLLLTSAVFLFLYYISNFVVPEIVLKDLEHDYMSKDQKSNSDNPFGDEKQSTPRSDTSSQKEKQGFNSKKR